MPAPRSGANVPGALAGAVIGGIIDGGDGAVEPNLQRVAGTAIAGGDEFLRGFHAKEFHQARNAFFLPSDLGDVRGGLHSEHRNPLGFEMLEQVAVIAGDLDDLAEDPDRALAIAAGKAWTFAMKRYEWATRRKVGRFWQFIEKFYTKHLAQVFFQPTNKHRILCAINCTLAGRTAMTFAIWWRIRLFFTIVWLQQHIRVTVPIEIK